MAVLRALETKRIHLSTIIYYSIKEPFYFSLKTPALNIPAFLFSTMTSMFLFSYILFSLQRTLQRHEPFEFEDVQMTGTEKAFQIPK